MTATQLDIAGVRARFSALSRPTAFLDNAGGTQAPDEVIDAIADYLRRDNANTGGAFATSRRTDALIGAARDAAAGFLGCLPDEVVFGASTTSLNFALTRAFARELEPGDEVLVTRLDHDANIAPWLELSRDIGIVVTFVEPDEHLHVDLDDLDAKLSARTRVVAFPAAANGAGTAMDVPGIVRRVRAHGALAWVDAVQRAAHAPLELAAWDADVVLCSPYKAFGPHVGVAAVRDALLRRWRPYKVRPAASEPLGHRHEQGAAAHELLAGFVASVRYLESIGWPAVQARETALGERFLAGLSPSIRLLGPRTMHGRVATFAFTVPDRSPREVAQRLADEFDIAVWDGDHYAVELARHLGLHDSGGTVRASFVHYNTEDEVDRLLSALDAVA